MVKPRTSKNFLKRARKYAYYQYVLVSQVLFEKPIIVDIDGVPVPGPYSEPIENYDEVFDRVINDVNSDDENSPLMFVDKWGRTFIVLSDGLDRLRYLDDAGCNIVLPSILDLSLVEDENDIDFEDSVKNIGGPTLWSISDFIELANKNDRIWKTVAECIRKYSFEDDTFPLDKNWKDDVLDEEGSDEEDDYLSYDITRWVQADARLINVKGIKELYSDLDRFLENETSAKTIDENTRHSIGSVFSPENVLRYTIMLLEEVLPKDNIPISYTGPVKNGNRRAFVISNRYLISSTRLDRNYTDTSGVCAFLYNKDILEEIKEYLDVNGLDIALLKELLNDSEKTVEKALFYSNEYVKAFIERIEQRLFNCDKEWEIFEPWPGKDECLLYITNEGKFNLQKEIFESKCLKIIIEELVKQLHDENIIKPQVKDMKISDAAIRYTRYIKKISEKVIGQDAAVDEFVKGLYTSSMNEDPDMPEATYLLVGPPGVGKTYLAKQVAELLGRPHKIFQMNSYTSDNAVHDLIGFASTWKAAKDGELTRFVSDNPRAVLIFDEIEKAHTNVIRLFLSVLEGAFLESLFTGKKVDFSKTICIFTTNAGRDYFEAHYGEDFSKLSQATLLDIVKNDLSPKEKGNFDASKNGLSAFPLEVLSRFAKGHIIPFSHMTAEKLIPMVKEGLRAGAEVIKEKHHIDTEYDEAMFPYLFLYTMGQKLDARMATARSKSFLLDNVYDILSRANQEPEKYNDITKIRFTFGGNDDLVQSLLTMTDKKHVMISCSAGNRDMYIGAYTDKEQKMGQGERCIWHYVWAKDGSEESARLYNGDAQRLFENNDVAAAIIDFTFGPNNDAGAVGDGVLNRVTRGTELFKWLKDNHPEVPVYAISFGRELGLADKKQLRQQGVKDFIVCDKTVKDTDKISKAIQSIDNISYGLFLDEKMNELARGGQVLAFETDTEISKDGSKDGPKVNVILQNFDKVTSMDEESKELFVSADELSKVGFEDVIGAEDAKQELKKFIKFIENPKEYADTGLKVSRGILLYGPPGTGKTMMAKALAKEAQCPFISTTGAAIKKGEQSIKKAFAIARRYAPSIIFIDEIDAFALNRQTGGGDIMLVNELLTEMDGFGDKSSRPVFVIAATNFGSAHSLSGENILLDPALLRRFGSRIYVDLPGKAGITTYLLKQKEKLSGCKISLDDLSKEDIASLAERMFGTSLAEIDNLINKAGTKALMNETNISRDMLVETYEEMNYGKKLPVKEEDMLLTARHEAGHAVVGYVEGGWCSPEFATVQARASFLGYVQHEVDESSTDHSKNDLLGKIRTSLAGRATELVFYGSEDGLNAGISNDLENASRLAYMMVTSFGMSENHLFYYPNNSGALTAKYCEEADAILQRELENTIKIVKDNKETVDKFAHELLEKGHLGKEDINRICGDIKK